jgi:hypothetical protein
MTDREHPSISCTFELPRTSVWDFDTGHSYWQQQAEEPTAWEGEVVGLPHTEDEAWWAGINPYPILEDCHYSPRPKNEWGDLEALYEGIKYRAMTGAFSVRESAVYIPWQAIQGIEISPVYGAGLFAFAAKKSETYTYVNLASTNTVWSFATKAEQPRVLARVKPILDAFNSRAQTVPPDSVASRPLSVADELTKLAKLKADGVITEEEFGAQKAKLLS